MVEDTDNAATHFLQGKHVVDLEGPAPNLQDSIDKMIETVEKMKLGSTADGVEAPSRPEGVASAAAVPSGDAAPMDDPVVEQTTHKWKVFGRGTSSPTFILADVPFQHEAVTKDIKQMVDKFSTEEIYDLFVKFCDSESIPAVSFGRVIKAYMAMKAQKVHDEVMKQPHVPVRSRPLAGKLTGADVPPEEAFHPKRPEGEMLKVVQDNADILHDMQSGAMSVEDPQGAEALRHLDLVKKEVLKRKFLKVQGPTRVPGKR